MAVAGYIEIEEGTVPSTPSTGKWRVYFKTDGLYIVDDAGVETNIAVSLSKELNIPAGQMFPSTTGGSAALAQIEFTTNDVDMKSLDFDQSTDEYAQFTVWMPDDWDAGTVTFKVAWTAQSPVTGGDVIWGLQAEAFADDGALDTAWGSAQTVTDSWIANDDMHYTAESGALTIGGTVSAGEVVQFRVYRDANNGNDTLDGDAKLLAIKIYYS